MKKDKNPLSTMNWLASLMRYTPQTTQETQDKTALLIAAQTDGSKLLSRTRTEGHITCTGFVMNPTLDAVLMVYHNIYDSFCWIGGHADDATDFLAVAAREITEETGVQKAFPLSGAILSIDILPVQFHQKQGMPVAVHVHYNITYGFIADPKEKLCIKSDENSAVQWIATTELTQVCKEPNRLPIYEKCIARMKLRIEQQRRLFPRLAQPLLTWYPSHARDLPWRHTKDPYSIWISEVMLQQTRVETVKFYYTRFLKHFPNIATLAHAEQDAVNKCWEGLGYYSRAANLRKAALEIMTRYNGKFPNTYTEIRSLPGIGDYTAGAICSICFEQETPAVDGNVLRVIARITDCFCPTDFPKMKTAVTAALTEVYAQNKDSCATLTQALMELGATVCLPNGTPHCDTCPLETICLAKENHDTPYLPRRTEKKKRQKEQYTVFILCCNGKYAVQKRTAKGLLHGMWEYPNLSGIYTDTQAIEQVRLWQCHPLDFIKSIERKHIFTHVEWNLHGVFLNCAVQSPKFLWKTPEEITTEISLPTAFRCVFTPEQSS